jgi:hypothetical protein
VENKIVDSGPPPPPPPPGGVRTYNAATKSVTAAIPVGGTATLAVVGGAIHFGSTPTACGAATTTNTDSIAVNGAAGSVEALTVDQTGGALAPGAGLESNGIAEIELALNLGDATDQIVFGHGWRRRARSRHKGVSYHDTDVDDDRSHADRDQLVGGEGDDILTARGGCGSDRCSRQVVLRGEGGADH